MPTRPSTLPHGVSGLRTHSLSPPSLVFAAAACPWVGWRRWGLVVPLDGRALASAYKALDLISLAMQEVKRKEEEEKREGKGKERGRKERLE